MNKINLAEYLYNKLPDIYREEDKKPNINFTLKKFLESLNEGGLEILFDDILNLYTYLDVEKCPNEILPLISRMLGYNYIEEVDITTQRKIISNLITLYERKGTKSVIDFIAREFTGHETVVIETEYMLFKTWSPNPKVPTIYKNKEHKTLYKKVNALTSHLLSNNGKYNGYNIIIIADADQKQMELLNKLLIEFLPVFIKLYIFITDDLDKEFLIDNTIDTLNNITVKY